MLLILLSELTLRSAISSEIVAFAPGLYEYSKDAQSQSNKIVKEMSLSNITFECFEENSLRELRPTVGPTIIFQRTGGSQGHPSVIKTSNLIEHLESETRKNLLVIWIKDYLMKKGDEDTNKIAEEFESIIPSLGYKRVIILAFRKTGIQIYRDAVTQ